MRSESRLERAPHASIVAVDSHGIAFVVAPNPRGF
jgi:hypothetical protein